MPTRLTKIIETTTHNTKIYDVSDELKKKLDYQIETDLIYKLAKYEDIEEELGIPLETLFKVIINGYWFVDWDGTIRYSQGADMGNFDDCYTFEKHKLGIRTYHNFIIRFTDYGVKWSLNREELEKNNESK